MPNAPIQSPVSDASGRPVQVWAQWFGIVSKLVGGGVPFPVAAYQVSSVPPAVNNAGCMIYVTNEAGGATMAFSDGTNWRRVQDRAIVS